MTSHPIRTAYNIQNAQLNMHTTLPLMEMETTPPKLDIQQPQGKLTIDSTEYYNSVGLKTRTALMRDFADEGKRAVMEAIAATVEEGNRLLNIAKEPDAITSMAFETRFSEQGKLEWTPIAAPVIRYDASKPQIELVRGRVDFTPRPGGTEYEYQPGKIDIQVTQYPSLEISVVDIRI
jgi:hypothetical protein